MAHWALVVPAERYARERLFAHPGVELPPDPAAVGVRPGDLVLLIAAGPRPLLFGLGEVRPCVTGGMPDPPADPAASAGGAGPGGAFTVAYTHRLLDDPVPGVPAFDGTGLHPLAADAYEAQAGRIGADRRVDADKRTWLVSVDLPIEAATAAEAVRAFWSYVYELGPGELPAFVTPSHDELAMRAFVLGTEANLDPEEDD